MTAPEGRRPLVWSYRRETPGDLPFVETLTVEVHLQRHGADDDSVTLTIGGEDGDPTTSITLPTDAVSDLMEWWDDPDPDAASTQTSRFL